MSLLPEQCVFRTSDGFGLAYYVLAGGSGGPPIILQHGYSSSTRHEWVECGIAGELAGLDRPVLGLDALGHGASDKPHDERHYGEARMACDISELVDHLGFPQFDLVGYSMGGVIAVLVGTREPRLRRLALGGIGEAVVLLGGVDTRALDNRLLAMAMRAELVADLPPSVRGFREGAEARGNDRLALGAQAAVVHAEPIAFERITAPTLVLAGDADPLAVRPEVLAGAIAGARLAVIPGDHSTARLSAAFVTTLVDFLR